MVVTVCPNLQYTFKTWKKLFYTGSRLSHVQSKTRYQILKKDNLPLNNQIHLPKSECIFFISFKSSDPASENAPWSGKGRFRSRINSVRNFSACWFWCCCCCIICCCNWDRVNPSPSCPLGTIWKPGGIWICCRLRLLYGNIICIADGNIDAKSGFTFSNSTKKNSCPTN